MKKVFLYFLLLITCFESLHAQQKIRLTGNWEFLKQDLGGIWESVRPVKPGNPESVPVWDSISLPHCVNARDAVDPDVNYYQGPSWYRTMLNVSNPYSKGRTILHFEGAGQKTEVYIYTTKVGSHVGGYDEWMIDITDAVEVFKKSDSLQKQFKGKIPVSIRCDNSRDLEMIPSNLSDFNVYGGIYRYLNLIYVPQISFDKLFVNAELDSTSKSGKLNIKARFYNPSNMGQATVSVKLIDPSGKIIQQTEKKVNDLEGDITVSDFTIKTPQLWSTDKPILYTVEATVTSGDGVFTQTEKIGFRNFEFVKKGPFMLNGKRLLIRGTQRHEDHAGVAAAMSEDMMQLEKIIVDSKRTISRICFDHPR